jgi:hypothetical protein
MPRLVELRRAQGYVDWLGREIASRPPDANLLTVYPAERHHLSKLADAIVRNNLDERKAALTDDVVDTLEQAINTILRDLGHNPSNEHVRRIVGRPPAVDSRRFDRLRERRGFRGPRCGERAITGHLLGATDVSRDTPGCDARTFSDFLPSTDSGQHMHAFTWAFAYQPPVTQEDCPQTRQQDAQASPQVCPQVVQNGVPAGVGLVRRLFLPSSAACPVRVVSVDASRVSHSQ